MSYTPAGTHAFSARPCVQCTHLDLEISLNESAAHAGVAMYGHISQDYGLASDANVIDGQLIPPINDDITYHQNIACMVGTRDVRQPGPFLPRFAAIRGYPPVGRSM